MYRTWSHEQLRTITVGTPIDMDTLQAINHAHGYHFFEPSSKRFFDSRIGREVYTGKDGWYFITSEQFHDYTHNFHEPRMYTVRKMNQDGGIDTVGKFQQYATAAQARREAKRLAESN